MKNKIDWKKLERKITSRKLWLAIAGLTVSVVTLVSGNAELAERVSAIVLAAASVVGYLIAEGLVDSASADKQPEKHVEYHIQDQPLDNDKNK